LRGVTAVGEAGLIQPPFTGAAFNATLEHSIEVCNQISRALQRTQGIAEAPTISYPALKNAQDVLQLLAIGTLVQGNVEWTDQLLRALSRFPEELVGRILGCHLTWSQLAHMAVRISLLSVEGEQEPLARMMETQGREWHRIGHVAAWHGLLLWLLTWLSAAANIATGLLHDVGPPVVQATALTIPLLLFAFLHGTVQYRFRDLLVFAIIVVGVSNVFENLSIATGFPFGRYHYNDKLGPKIFQVPVVIGLAFIAVGYLSWMLARILVRAPARPVGHCTFAVPVVASFIMVAWDLSFDPLASTVRQVWIWQNGGSFFGVPATNFLGWYLTGYVFFQLYAFYLRDRAPEHGAREHGARELQPREYWLQPVVVYGTLAAIVILSAFTVMTSDTVMDQAGAIWRIHEVYAACAVVCLFTMGAFTTLCLFRIADLQVTRR
jgi:uncharacterized membrane protein